jgi:Ni/Co efflux regulator RcnB
MKRVVILLIAAVFAGGMALAQEHPEHPTSKKAEKKGYTVDDLDKAIRAAIAAKETNGIYQLKDGDKTWDLKLDKVHRERLSRIDESTYFACTDFKSADNHTVDVDFFMKDDGGKLAMTDATLHKVDGKPRYNWKEKDGYWVRVPVE